MQRAIAISAAAGLVVSVGAAQAHASPSDEPPIVVEYADDFGCDEGGVAQMCDGFWWGSADAVFPQLSTQQDGVTLTVSGDFDSTFFVDVREAQASGEWLIGGNWTMGFSGPVDGVANVTLSGGGDISGSAATFSVAGSQTNSGTVNIGGATNSINNTDTLDGVDVTVTGGTCVEVTGVWRQSWAALAAEVGWTGTDTINGEFTALRQEQDDAERLEEILIEPGEQLPTDADYEAASLPPGVEAYARALNDLTTRTATVFAEGRVLNEADLNGYLDSVEDVEQAIAEIRNLAGCEAEIVAGFPVRWADITATIATNVVRAVSEGDPDLSGATVKRLTEALVRSGAIGVGSRQSPETQARIRVVLSREANSVLARNLERVDGALKYSVPGPGARGESFDAASAARLGDFEIVVDGLEVRFSDETWAEWVAANIAETVSDDLFADESLASEGSGQ